MELASANDQLDLLTAHARDIHFTTIGMGHRLTSHPLLPDTSPSLPDVVLVNLRLPYLEGSGLPPELCDRNVVDIADSPLTDKPTVRTRESPVSLVLEAASLHGGGRLPPPSSAMAALNACAYFSCTSRTSVIINPATRGQLIPGLLWSWRT